MHSLAFRVMRLCRPSFQMDPLPLRLDPADLLVGEDLFDDPLASTQLPRLLRSNSNASDADPTYRSRLLISDPSDSIGLSGLLVLPQSFGSISINFNRVSIHYVTGFAYLSYGGRCDLQSNILGGDIL